MTELQERPTFSGRMTETGTVTGWKLPEVERELLLRRFPPKYEKVDADHVTLRVGAGPKTPLPHRPEAQVVGRADDCSSLECLVVALDGTTERPDGSTYHITWSLGRHRKPRESNDLLRDKGWDYIEAPIPVELEPARF